MEKLDLNNNKYSLYILKKNIWVFNIWDILKTQKINEAFASNYILNKAFQLTPEEEKITIADVMKYQTHLDEKLLLRLLIIGPPPELFPNFDYF
jgi:hypothetical protein